MIKKIAFSKYKFGDFIEGWQGEINVSTKKEFFTEINKKYHLPLIRGNNIGIYCMVSKPKEYCPRNVSKRSHHSIRRIVIQEVSNAGLLKRIKGCILKDVLCGHTTNYIIPKIKKYNLFFLLNPEFFIGKITKFQLLLLGKKRIFFRIVNP